MKSLLETVSSILQDCGMQCGANPNRDILTVARRVEYEGDSFLTITLPAFCAEFERALSEGRFSPAHSTRFKSGRGTCLPRFLGGFMEKIFDSKGALLQHPSVDCIKAVRQICLLCKKILLPCSKRRMINAEKKFVEIESELRNHVVDPCLHRIFCDVSRVIWSDLVGGVPFGDPYNELRPRHGPGVTAEGLRGNKKYLFPSWFLRLERVFPFSEFGISSTLNSDGEHLARNIPYLSPRDELPVKVVLVPKTLKTPRVIAVEPNCMQFTQQAIADWIRPRIEQRRYTSGHVNFTRQDVNASLALTASADGSYATIDLSDASDRVSCKLVRDMLRSVPAFSRYVFATRSTRAKLPSGGIIHLRKFASMGSALCFPIESMVFFIAIVSKRIYDAGVRPTPRSIRKYSDGVYVYGDDIVVPTDVAPSMVIGLSGFGLKVNPAKTFVTGKFRESCGVDAYDGVNVTPVYIRRMIPNHRADAHGLVSSVSLANQLYWAGYWRTCRGVRESVEKLIGTLPSIRQQDQVLGWESFSNALSFSGWHKDYQRPKLRCYVPIPTKLHDPLDGDPALLKCLRIVGLPVSPDHLRASVRFGNLALKRRWI